MHPQLEQIVQDFDRATARLEQLRSSIDEEAWTKRPSSARWSPAECVAHLNLTAEAFLPELRDAIERAPEARSEVRYRRDFFGWLLWKMLPPPVRFKVKTPAPFVPTSDDPLEVILERFTTLQDEQVAFTRRCDGLRIDKVKIRSPFDQRVRYNVYASLTILSVHQHRHLWQAEVTAQS